MQELRFVAVSEDGSYAVLAVPGRSGRYVLPIDERLRAIANGQTSRLAQYEIEVESPLRPKEIQARIRAGETAEEIADAAGIPIERVRWFEGPVLAERAYIADQAQAASVRRAGDSGPGARLGEIVPARLTASGADPDDAQWDSRKRGDGHWEVTLSFPSRGRVHIAEWVFDPRRRHVMPDDDNAARLSLPESELPPEPVALPGEATVTPLAPRLGAAAGMGGGGVSSVGGLGGFASGGPGIGVRSFRPERSVIPDRSLGADRTLAAERSPVVSRPSQDHAVHHDHAGFRDAAPGPAPYPAAEPSPSRSPELSYRAPEPTVHRDPVQAPEAMPVPDRPRRPQPIMSRDPEPTIILRAPEPPALDEQLEFAPPTSTPAPAAARTAAPPAASTVAAPTGSAPQPQPQIQIQPEPEPEPEPQPEQVAPVALTPAAPVPTPATVAVQQPPTRRPMPSAMPEPAPPVTPEPVTPEPVTPAIGIPATETPAVAATAPAERATAASVPALAPEAEAESEPVQAAAETESAAAETEKAAAEATDRAGDDSSGRTRSSSKRNAKGRRSSVPSWDEIMLGSSRQRD